MGQAVARNSVVERKWVKDWQHFSAELRDFRCLVEANSQQMHYSVASSDQVARGDRTSSRAEPLDSLMAWFRF